MSAIPRKFFQPFAIAVALAFVYFSMLLKLGNDWWHDENYSHGLLIPFVIGFILWQERERLANVRRQPWTLIGAAGISISLFDNGAFRAGINGEFIMRRDDGDSDDLIGVIELVGLAEVRDVAGVQHEAGLHRESLDAADRLVERIDRGDRCLLVEADMAVGNLQEREAAAGGFGRLGLVQKAQGLRNAA